MARVVSWNKDAEDEHDEWVVTMTTKNDLEALGDLFSRYQSYKNRLLVNAQQQVMNRRDGEEVVICGDTWLGACLYVAVCESTNELHVLKFGPAEKEDGWTRATQRARNW